MSRRRIAGGWSRSAHRFLLGPLAGLLVAACAESSAPVGCDGDCAPPSLVDTFDTGALEHRVVPREGWGGLKVRLSGDRAFVLEATRDGQLQSRRRLVASSTAGGVLWALDEAAGEHFSDFTLHPSGELTLAVERTQAERGGYDLLRLSSEGQVLARAPLPFPETLPSGELGGDLPERPFRMKSREWHALRDGWVRTEARGEDVVAAFLSLVDEPSTRPGGSGSLVTGVMALRWTEAGYTEVWARVVDGRHRVEPGAWAYDEFRWREAPARPLLAVDPVDGRVIVGRTWNALRCLSSSERFQTPTRVQCQTGEDVTSYMDTDYQPLAYTTFSPEGAREETRSFVPASVAEFVVFDLAAKGGEVAVAGAVVAQDAEGVIAYYPPSPGSTERMTPYDGYVAVLGRVSGVARFERTVDGGGRADHFSALRWTDDGLLAVGASGWDRWHGGKSISRGAGPLVALVSLDGAEARVRSVPLDGSARHFHLLGVDARAGEVVAVGLSDAPLTHSGDGGRTAEMTFGGLVVDLR
ncbi:hypothetical protein ACN47A_07095 [Myxococcus fulvus]|uniref:hypothetical protein n=1 Tax=Myxococcus fulvus TaxID=33 RepID=UPI003B9B6698